MKKYLILPGASFRLQDGSLKEAGEEIELASDVAAAHPHSVRLVPTEAPEKALPDIVSHADDPTHTAPHVPTSLNPSVA